MIFFQILEANFQVQFSGTSDNMFSRLFRVNLDHRIRFGQSFKTFDELGQISGVLALNSDTDDGGDREFHLFHVVSSLKGRNSSSFDEVLIDSDETDQVSAWNIIDSFDVTSHHKNGTLDLFVVEILFGTGLVVGSHNSDLLAGGNGSGEDTSESVESTLVKKNYC